MVYVESNAIKLGDTVISKQTGLPMAGKVMGIMYADFYRALTRNQFKCSYERWTELYPLWEEKTIIMVLFSSPIKNLTFEEYIKGYRKTVENDIADDELQVLYKYTVPETISAYYPEEDVEVL